MSARIGPDSSTDRAWEAWGRQDPYFGVITDPKFRREQLTEGAKAEFFETGRAHVEHVLHTIRTFVDPRFDARSILDFGCGVGRALVHFAERATAVCGIDVSLSMLAEAQRNCAERQIGNVRLVQSDDALAGLDGTFDLIHSAIVFQHIPPERGRELLRRLLDRLSPGGVGALHFLYSKASYLATHGVAPRQEVQPVAPTPTTPGRDPEIQMNPYEMNQILFLLQRRGVDRFHAEFTDHGGELGMFVFFRVK
jgi:SAM-dependent methyltransferase